MGAEADPFLKAMKVGAEAATQANKAATTNVDRLEGFKSQLASEHPGIELVDSAYSPSQPAGPRKCMG